MNNGLLRQFNLWRVLAIVALVCTVCLSVVLCAESLKPGEQSSNTSGSVVEDIKDIVDVPDNDQNYELVSIRCKNNGASLPVGETLKLEFSYTPSKATSKELTFISSDPNCVAVDEEGVLSFLSYGEVTITAKSKSNPKIKTSFKVICTGTVAEDITDIYPTFDVDNANAEPKYFVPAGTYSYIAFRNTLDQIVSITSLDVVCHNPDVLYMNSQNYFVAIKPGTAKVTITSQKTNQTKDITIEVTPSDTFVAPEDFVFDESVMYINTNTTFAPKENISVVLPSGATFDTRFCSINCSNTTLFDVAREEYTALTTGEAIFSITSYATGKVSSFKVVVVEPSPTSLTIMGNDRIVTNKQYSYTAFDGERDCDNVVWSVVKGNATITDDGVLVASDVGRVVIRATSVQDKSVLTEMTVQVSLFENFHSFVRKMFGHFSAFAVLGFGFAVTYFLLCGRVRKLSPLFAVTSGVFVAGLTEILQLPFFTANRGPSFKDVLLDSAGVLCGVAIAVIVILLVFAIVKLTSKQRYQQMKLVISKLSFKSMLCPSRKVNDLLSFDEDTTTTLI